MASPGREAHSLNGHDDGQAAGNWPQGVHFTEEDRVMIEQGKREHRETTASARRALQVAEETVVLAKSTLVEVHRQGQQMEIIDHTVDQIHEDVKEASGILRFMRRCCCFQVLCCCDCWDPTVKEDRTRARRVAQKRESRAMVAEEVELEYAGKAQAVDRLTRQHDPAYGLDNEEAARSELFLTAEQIRAKHRADRATDIGLGLPEEDRAQIQRETDVQEQLIDQIGSAVDGLKIMSSELRDELGAQAPRIERLQEQTTVAHDNLGQLTRTARRI